MSHSIQHPQHSGSKWLPEQNNRKETLKHFAKPSVDRQQQDGNAENIRLTDDATKAISPQQQSAPAEKKRQHKIISEHQLRYPFVPEPRPIL